MGKYQRKKKKRTWLAAALVLSAVLLLIAGGMLLWIRNRRLIYVRPAEPSEHTVLETAAPETEPETEPEEARPWYRYSDPDEWITPGEEGSLPGDIPAAYRLPAMNESLAAAPEFSQWISERHEDWFTTASWIQSAHSAESIRLDYHCGVYDDLLSVTMEYTLVMGGEETRGWPYSESFTVDLRTGEQLTADRFIELYGGSWERMEEFLRTQLKEHYTRMREFFAGVEGIEEMQEKELASENIRKVRVVLDASRGGQILVLIPQLFTTTVDKQIMLTEEDFYQFPVDSPDEIFG